MIESRPPYIFPTTCRLATVAFLACAAPFAVQAQQRVSDAPARPVTVAELAAQPLNLDLKTVPGIGYSDSNESSSTSAAPGRLDFGTGSVDAMQPPPRRRYGRPRYTDRLHNADGSNKIAVMAGVGLTIPVGSVSTNYLSPSYKVQGGIGVNFNKDVALLLQVDYDHFGLPGSLIASQRAYYNALGFYTQDPNTGAQTPVDFSGLDGSTHIWSITLNPTFNLYQGDSFGAYAVVGGGFYHKVTDFTLPQQQQGFDYFYGPYTYTANSTFDHYTSNSPGVNGGIGFTYKPSRFASERIYAEARFVHTFDRIATHGQSDFDFFPANHLESNYVPITVGIRF